MRPWSWRTNSLLQERCGPRVCETVDEIEACKQGAVSLSQGAWQWGSLGRWLPSLAPGCCCLGRQTVQLWASNWVVPFGECSLPFVLSFLDPSSRTSEGEEEVGVIQSNEHDLFQSRIKCIFTFVLLVLENGTCCTWTLSDGCWGNSILVW